MERVEFTFDVLLKMALEFEILCLGDCVDVRERTDGSAASSSIYGILHVRAKNIACVSGYIREMLFLGRSRQSAFFTNKNFC